MLYTEQTKKAMKIAYEAHKDQLDKSGIPYIYHPIHLAEQMQDENTVCVALLHDVVEDTQITFEELLEAGFSDEIIEALKLLTHDDEVLYMDYVRAIKKNPIATKVKLADLKHNSDLSRLDVVNEKALKRVEKYKEAIEILEDKSELNKENVIISYIGFQNAKTGVFGYEFYDESLKNICSMGAVLEPGCEHMHIKGFGLCWNSEWNWDKTRNLMDCRVIMDSSGVKVAGITNYCDPENYTIFWDEEEIEVFIEENAYTFKQNRQVIASIERFCNDKYFPENCEDLMLRYGLCVRVYEELPKEIMLLILSFPTLKF